MRKQKASFPAEYKEFLERCPDWLRKQCLGEMQTLEDGLAFANSDSVTVARLYAEHDALLARYPELRKQWESRVGRGLTGHIKRPPRGRPRKEAEALEAIQLRKKGQSYGKIAIRQDKKPDAVRKLVQDRASKSRGEKSP